MTEDSIALIPAMGYQNHETSSYKSYLWMKYLSESNNIFIKHARNGHEYKIEKYKVDGYCSETSTVYEFHGCLWHGCPTCYTPSTFNVFTRDTMENTYNRHLLRIKFLKSKTSVIEIWECDYDRKCKNDDKFKQFVNMQMNIRAALNPRDALTGGRTNASVLYYKGEAGYVGFTSLYPYIQKYGSFPIGHPVIVTENFKTVTSYFGLIYCRVLSPQHLYFPILPTRDGKLIFALCATCAKLKQYEQCNHNEDERVIEGTWVSLELNKAIKEGYVVKQIFEVWHWDKVEKYDEKTKSGGIFTGYVNTFLKIKQEASGYPIGTTNEDEYINKYYEREGILLEKDKIKPNPGLKAISKLLLNSQWGRYAMNTKKTQCKFVSSLDELYAFVYNNQYILKQVLYPNEDICIVYYEECKEMHWGSNQTNVVIAAFVTSQARLKLYSEMEKLDQRVLYYDTDSIIYKLEKDGYNPKIGDYLGDFTNEINPSEGNHIVEFASAGPKNYTYKLDTGISYCKVKGFFLNATTSKLIDFEKIRLFVLNRNEGMTQSITENNKEP